MYAIVNIAGKQYKVTEGGQLKIATLDSQVGEKISFKDVLLTDDGKKISVGKPVIKNVSITAEVLQHGRERKVLIYKKKRRKGYQRKNGHRQGFTLIQVKKIQVAAAQKAKPAPKSSKVETTKTKKGI